MCHRYRPNGSGILATNDLLSTSDDPPSFDLNDLAWHERQYPAFTNHHRSEVARPPKVCYVRNMTSLSFLDLPITLTTRAAGLLTCSLCFTHTITHTEQDDRFRSFVECGWLGVYFRVCLEKPKSKRKLRN